jgi:hypothetical protein
LISHALWSALTKVSVVDTYSNVKPPLFEGFGAVSCP